MTESNLDEPLKLLRSSFLKTDLCRCLYGGRKSRKLHVRSSLLRRPLGIMTPHNACRDCGFCVRTDTSPESGGVRAGHRGFGQEADLVRLLTSDGTGTSLIDR